MVIGHAYRATISGGGFASDTLPFALEPGGGARARVRHLVLDLQNIVLRDLPIRSLQADIPFVELDGLRALFSGHITLRSAQEGRGVAIITEEGLAQFLQKRRSQFRNLEIRLFAGEAFVKMETVLLVAPTQVQARAKIGIAEGRFLNAIDAVVSVGGKPLPAALTEKLLRSLNPILDIDRDLGLRDWLYVTDAEIGEGILTVRARVTIPQKQRESAAPER
jgi:hypothetical protein